jgi:3-oxoacyl-[acyl-carrier protein] reductase
MKLENRIALVTGAGRGIGASISKILAGEGARVAVNDVDMDLARSVAEDLRRRGRDALPVQCDVSKNSEVTSMVEQVLLAYGKIDILVNNAGISPEFCSIEELTEENWDRVLNINLKGTFLCSKAVIGPMKLNGFGRIINIASVSGKLGRSVLEEKTKANYCASKAGIISLTKSLARELAPWGITANALAPGPIESNMSSRFPVEHIRKEVPLGRFGKPDDVAYAALFLASEEASYITGATLDINGGMLMD